MEGAVSSYGSGYTITFNGNGGTVTSGTAKTNKDGYLEVLPGAIRSATSSYYYTFNGWYTSTSGGTQITSSYKFTSNTTVYAQWTSGSINSGGGGGGTTPTETNTSYIASAYVVLANLDHMSTKIAKFTMKSTISNSSSKSYFITSEQKNPNTTSVSYIQVQGSDFYQYILGYQASYGGGGIGIMSINQSASSLPNQYYKKLVIGKDASTSKPAVGVMTNSTRDKSLLPTAGSSFTLYVWNIS